MNFNKILKYWEISFRFLSYNQLKLFSLASLNNFIRSTKLFLKYFWWLIILKFFFIFSNILVNKSIISAHKTVWITVTNTFIIFFYLLTCRASIERKDLEYFLDYSKALLLVFFLIFPHNIIIIGTFLLICSFFYLDSTFSFNSLIQSIKNGLILGICFPLIILLIDLVYWLISMCVVFLLFAPYSACLFSPLKISIKEPFTISTILVSNLLILLLRFLQLSFLSTLYLYIKHTYPNLFLKTK